MPQKPRDDAPVPKPAPGRVPNLPHKPFRVGPNIDPGRTRHEGPVDRRTAKQRREADFEPESQPGAIRSENR